MTSHTILNLAQHHCADIIASMNVDTLIASIGFGSHDSVMNELGNVLKCIIPRAFTRPVINKGLLHHDVLVKHGSLRVLFESLKLVDSLINRIDGIIDSAGLRSVAEIPGERMAGLHGLPGLSSIAEIDRLLGMNKMSSPHTDEQEAERWVSIKQYIQDEVRVLLPDPQVLVKLFSTPSSRVLKHAGTSLKRCASLAESGLRKFKKLKSESINDNIDLVIGGIDDEFTADISETQKKAKSSFTENELDVDKDIKMTMTEIWGLNKSPCSINVLTEPEIYLYSKLLDILTFYLRAMPNALDSTFDFFKILPNDPLNLSFDQQQSVFSMLIECIGLCPGGNTATRAPELMYRHLQPLINTLVFSEDINVQEQAYILARAAMISTGAFDQNLLEVDAWLVFIPGFNTKKNSGKTQITEMFRDWSKVVISFLCDAVSTIGNNLYKNMDHMRQLIFEIYGHNDSYPGFSPLTICILQKCLRLLDSDSGNFKLHEKSCISLYVCSTLILISQMEVGTTLLPRLVQSILTEKFKPSCSNDEDSKASLCEWMPLRNLLLFASNIVNRPSCSSFCALEGNGNVSDNSFTSILERVKGFLENDHVGGLEGVAVALSSSIFCASRDDILKSFPLLIMSSKVLFRSHLQLLSWAFFSDPRFLADVAHRWSDMFFSAFEMIGGSISHDRKSDSDISSKDDANFILRSTGTDNVDQTESAAIAFSLLLKQSPFYLLLSGIMSFGSCKLDSTKILGILRSTRVLDLLRIKLFEGSERIPILYLQCLLFWAHHILSAYRAKPCDVLEELFYTCFTLIEDLFEHLVAGFSDTANSKTSCKSTVTQFQDAIDLIMHHPTITLSFSCPLSSSKKVQSDNLGDCVETFLASSKQCYHPIDQRVLLFSKKVIEFLTVFCNGSSSYNLDHASFEQILKAPADLVEKTELLFKEKFEFCVMTRDLGPLPPSFYAFHALARLKSPFELLRLVRWMFCKLDNEKSGYISAYVPVICVALFIADIALDMLYMILKQPMMKSQLNLFLDLNTGDFDLSILKNIYFKILDFAMFFNLQCADECLFKVANAVHKQKFVKPQPALLPLYMLSLRMFVGCPTKTFLHLFYPASKTKAKTLLHLIEASPVHMSLFGKIFTGIVINNLSVIDSLNMGITCLDEGEIAVERQTDAQLEGDFVLMLPAALSYLTKNINETQKQDFKIFENMLAFYSRVLLDGFSNWKRYVSGDIFHEDFDDLELELLADFSQLFCCSLLGKAVLLLQYAFAMKGISIGTQQRLKIFYSIYPHSTESDEILDGELRNIESLTFNESLRLANEIACKITFTSLLLLPPEKSVVFGANDADEKFQEMPAAQESNQLSSAGLHFLNILITTLEYVVGKCPWRSDGFLRSCHTDSVHLLRYLEQSILQYIVQISTKIQSYLTQLPSIPFLIPFIRSSLLHRFEDPVRLKAIRCMISLSQGSFSYSEVFHLLLGHSKFVPTILYSESTSDPFVYSSAGTFLQPVPSILKSIVFPSIEQQNIGKSRCAATLKSTFQSGALGERKLELIKLLRVLVYYIKDKQQNTESFSIVGFNSKELISLLLSGYGATMSELDLETLHLMHEIESMEGSSYDIISEFDYLWGASVMKTRNELVLDGLVALNENSNSELMEEQHRRLFRENIPVDSGLCVMTVLHVCNDRTSRHGALSVKRLVDDSLMVSAEPVTMNTVQGYDPVFILRFAIHSLMMDYVDPIEFSQVGLLAVTLASISSADEEIRKLGYESLGRFKQALEKIRSKDALQIKLLLTYLQNGIQEPWQKIPSIIAIFAAEASFVLLDPSQDRFRKISKLLVHSPRVNLKTVPLLHTMFASDSIHFRSDCLWILRLLLAGLNSYDDAKIYLGNGLLELLLSFYSSSLSDFGSNILIIQIVNRAVKVRLLANYLVKECGLISWLSTIVSSYGQQLDGGKKEISLKAMTCALKVLSDVLSLRPITEWLQDYDLEQLSELSTHLFSLLLGPLKFLKENIMLVNSILHVIKSTLMISYKRKLYQPHILFSLEGLFLLWQRLHSELDNFGFEDTFQLGIDILLLSLPMPIFSHMDHARLAKLFILAISAALSSLSCPSKEPDPAMVLNKDQRGKESVFMKLLRWIIASVILGRISGKSSKINSKMLNRTGIESLQSLLEAVEEEKDASREEDFRSNEALAAIILYLQQISGMNVSTISSVVSALCLLLLPSSSTAVKEVLDTNRSTIAFLCSKIRCPIEANSSWRWSYYQPWNNFTSSKTDIEEMEEKHACQSLLMIFSNAFGGEYLGLPPLSHQDVEISELFEWEKHNLLQTIQ
ncbi:uncharacterized protein LOC120280662 isoform X2 [Dioscorea cayenensis subsp. rotundata]|uniref:Uncharacterized protein LOC120280662 isoform X2 n=1 Tax=Dioscorea cayennensis subsp. rotundata TaxID=55577 RepID=A0AB40CU13_DIOCR|nr:uncharacterized protein LOC120280662 isoform X2 [Dioscorea cayenensis subsp. rotundata]